MITQPNYPMNGNSYSNLCKLCIYRYLGTFVSKVVPLNEDCPTIFEHELLGSIIISCPAQPDNFSSSLVRPPRASDVPTNIRNRHNILNSYTNEQRRHYADQVANGEQPDDPLGIPPFRSVPVSSLLGCEGKWVNLLIGSIFSLTPVVFRFDRLLQRPGGGYFLEGWLELPDGTYQQFGVVRPPYPASNIQVIWC